MKSGENMAQTNVLSEMKIGDTAVVKRLNIHGSMRRRLLDLGLCENAVVKCVGKSPLGDPSAYLICGAVIAIRATDARGVIVRGI